MEVKDYYNRISGYYDSDTKSPVMIAEDRILFEQINVSEGNSVLDAGCGTGLFLDSVNNNLISKIEYLGYDVSKGMLDVFSSKWPSVYLKEKSFLDPHEEFEGLFDIVISLYGSINCLSNLAELNIAISNLWMSVAPGGRLILVPYGNNSPEKRDTSVHNIFSDKADGYEFLNPSPRSWSYALSNLCELDSTLTVPFSEHVPNIDNSKLTEEEAYALFNDRLDYRIRKKGNIISFDRDVICDFLLCTAKKKG